MSLSFDFSSYLLYAFQTSADLAMETAVAAVPPEIPVTELPIAAVAAAAVHSHLPVTSIPTVTQMPVPVALAVPVDTDSPVWSIMAAPPMTTVAVAAGGPSYIPVTSIPTVTQMPVPVALAVPVDSPVRSIMAALPMTTVAVRPITAVPPISTVTVASAVPVAGHIRPFPAMPPQVTGAAAVPPLLRPLPPGKVILRPVDPAQYLPGPGPSSAFGVPMLVPAPQRYARILPKPKGHIPTPALPERQSRPYFCGVCKKLKTKENGHHHYKNKWYCPESGETYKDWLRYKSFHFAFFFMVRIHIIRFSDKGK